MANTEQPVWKPYPDYPFIEANQFGEIRTKNRMVIGKDGKKYHVKGRVLKQYPNYDGYMRVHLSINGKQVSLLVHRVVAFAFLPNPLGLPQVNHKDNNPKNNAVSNLEWCTNQYNQDYRKNFGTSPAQIQGRPVIVVNLETFEVFWYESQHEASRKTGASQGNINNVLKGRYRKTGGYWFCYAEKNTVKNVRKKFGYDVANEVEKLMNENCD